MIALELGFILGQNAKCLSSVLEKSNVVLFFLCLVVKETIFFSPSYADDIEALHEF